MERSAKAEERLAAATEKIAASVSALLRGEKSPRENASARPRPGINGTPAKAQQTRRS